MFRWGALDRLFAFSNRGALLDLVVFVLNLTAMMALSRYFVQVLRQANSGDKGAQNFLFCVAIALFVLAPLGAVLKRWDFHLHRRAAAGGVVDDPMGGCFFNPIFYFCLTAVIFSSINAYMLQSVYGKTEPPGGVFVSSIFIGIALMITHTALVYRYFVPPKREPRAAFLKSPTAAWMGDVCIFLNMGLFQVIWNLIASSVFPAPTGVADFVLRLLLFLFLALLLYFPPRIFYLATDIDKGRTWAMIALANAPVFARSLFGGDNWAGW